MTNPTPGRHHLPLGLLFGLVAAAVGLAVFSTGEQSQWRLVTALSQTQVGEGKLFRSSGRSPHPDQYQKALVDSAIELLKPRSALQLRIRSLLEMSAGDLTAASGSLSKLLEENPNDAEVLNDLGVVYLARGTENASNYFRAARLFDQSRRLTSSMHAPDFNAALVYRKLHLDEPSGQMDLQSESQLLDSLRIALRNNDVSLANQLLRKNLSSYRHAAVHSALNPKSGPADEAIEFTFSYLEETGTDSTIAAMRSPLLGVDRERVIQVRKLVAAGIEKYQHGKFQDASRSFDDAGTALAAINSPFDDLWLKLNRADTEIRLDAMQSAQTLLDTVISESRSRQYTWLLGMALTSKSADPRLARNFEKVVQTLDEAIATLTAIDAQPDTVRALNYLAAAYTLAGDFEKALDVTYRTLSITPRSNHLRRAQLFQMAGTEVYRLGLREYAGILGEKALLEATLLGNPGLVSSVSSKLAMFHALEGDVRAADTYLKVASTSSSQIATRRDRDVSELGINLLCARIRTDEGAFSEAEDCLRRNMRIFSQQRERVPYYEVQTLLQLGETHSLQGKFDEAHQNFQDAADALESDDVYLAAGGLRMAFENERRIFYEKAIAFEYDHGSKEIAWKYVQRYRSKLFLEFLGQLNQGVEMIRSAAIDRDKVQQLVPPNVQVIEYLVLEDRLLIWLVSKNKFVSTSVSVGRAELERRVDKLVHLTPETSVAEFQKQAQVLHRILIGPVADQLDSSSVLAIIPDQTLHRLNFPALYAETAKSFLLERYTILENASLTSLLSPGETPSRMGAVAFGSRAEDIDVSSELKTMQKYYTNVRTFDGPTASKATFLSSMTAGNVFLYSGHSQDASDPLRSAILLDGEKEGSNSVTAVDITKQRMQANSVVVLASCDSSVGNSRDGVGIRGLTSAFLISGAGSVVGSLWLVESKSTSRLVQAFHKAFAQDKLPVAEALRKAQLGFIAESIHPYYWSGFIVTGNVSALR